MGPGAGALQIQVGGTNNRVFNIAGIGTAQQRQSVTIAGMTIVGGSLTANNEASRGAAIRNSENLTLLEVEITGGSAAFGGGAIFNDIGVVNLERSLIQGTSSGGGGGGILNGSGGNDPVPVLNVNDSTISGNSTSSIEMRPGFGGGIFTRFGTVNINNSTISENFADAGGGGVATYGLAPDDTDSPRIITNIDHSIIHGNFSDDVFAVRNNVDGDPLIPILNIGNYNIIGTLGESALFPTSQGGNGHFYTVVSAPDGITWEAANNALAAGSGHLATPSSVMENDFIFDLIDVAGFWRSFQVEEDMALAAMTTQFIGPWLGGVQFDETEGNGDGWEWVTLLNQPTPQLPSDEPFADFQMWSRQSDFFDEPDNGVNIINLTMIPDPYPEENRLAYFSPEAPITANTWGDLPAVPADEMLPVAYVIEFDKGTNLFGVDPQLLPLDDYGGATRSYHIDITSPAIDAGDPLFAGIFDQRGRHFGRVVGAAVDIGAVEAQSGTFFVDTLVDENDRQYSRVYELDPIAPADSVPFPDYAIVPDSGGDFSLREALDFSFKNPFIDTIFFNPVLAGPDVDGADTTRINPAIVLQFFDDDSGITIDHSVNIVGPDGFILEVDAIGTDLTPTLNNADGKRVFLIDDNDDSLLSNVSISKIGILGGDVLDAGGAIKNLENLDLDTVTVKDSFASNNGGGIFTQFGELIVENSTLSNNAAGNNGGAIFVDTGLAPGSPILATVRNSTISGNTAVLGAGLYNTNGTLNVEFSTITQNISTIGGGPIAVGAGIASTPGPDATTRVLSSIVSDNQGGDIDFISGATNIQSLGFNLIGDGNASVVFNQPGDLRGVDPMLAPLMNTGGPVATHRLLLGSPAIDAGDPSAVPGVNSVPLNDQRGPNFDRVIDGDQDTKIRIDIGAYEAQGVTFIVDSPLDENDGVTSTFNFSLREAIEAANANPFPDTITFDPTLIGVTLLPGSGSLLPGTEIMMTITDSLTIIGLGEALLTIDGTFTEIPAGINPVLDPAMPVRLFDIDNGDSETAIDVTFSDLRIQNFDLRPNAGGVFKSHENLTFERVTFVNNSTIQTQITPPTGTTYNGGAIYQRYGHLTLDDVTLTANRTNGVNANGGAVYVRDGDLTILNNSVLSGNSTTQAFGSGGAAYLRNGVLNMSNSTITSNLAPGGEADGAGLFGQNATLNIDSSIISGNSMTGSNSEGAGIFSLESDLNLTNSVVSVNSTTGSQSEGAGMYISGGTALLDNVTIATNTTSGQDSVGAGLAVANGAIVEVVDSTVDFNSTSGIGASGGGLHNLGGQLTVRNSTVSNNSVTGDNAVGGGVYSDTNLSGTELTTIMNSTISGNSSDERGGGVYNANGRTWILHSTISNNGVPVFGYGGGLASYGDAATQSLVYSSIISGNSLTDVDRAGGSFVESIISFGYNVIGNGLSAGAFNAPGDQTGVTDAMLGPLADNGGPVETHALLVGSPAVNAGDPTFDPLDSTPSLNTDQRGPSFGRANGRIDVGSFESAFADFSGDGRSAGADFMAWLRGLGTTNANKPDGDADGNGIVDGDDLGILLGEYGGVSFESTTIVVAAAQAPEQVVAPEAEIVSAALAPSSSSKEVAVETVAPAVIPLTPEAELVEAITSRSFVDSSIEQGTPIAVHSRTKSADFVNLAGLKLGLTSESEPKDVAFESEELDGLEFLMASDSSTRIQPGQRSVVLDELELPSEESEEESEEASELLFEFWGSEA